MGLVDVLMGEPRAMNLSCFKMWRIHFRYIQKAPLIVK